MAIPHFDGQYDHWSMLMENVLLSKEYWSIVEYEIQGSPASVASWRMFYYQKSIGQLLNMGFKDHQQV